MRTPAILALAAALSACSVEKKDSSKPPERFKVDPATAGVVAGRALFEGKPKAAAAINIDEDTECVRLNPRDMADESLLVNRNKTLRNVLVYVKRGLEGKTFEHPAGPVVLNQQGCRFEPRVFGIQAGQTLQVTNSDPLTHNVHPLAKINRDWNQSQAPGDPPLERRFARPEMLIRVKCNIHSWMRSWAAVMDHPYFAVTGADGSFEIRNLPPGDYTLEAWHEVAGTVEKPVHLAPSAKAEIDFTFTGTGAP